MGLKYKFGDDVHYHHHTGKLIGVEVACIIGDIHGTCRTEEEVLAKLRRCPPSQDVLIRYGVKPSGPWAKMNPDAEVQYIDSEWMTPQSVLGGA